MSGVKMFAAIPRRSDLSEQAFHDRWRFPHGTLAKRISTITGYVQSHRSQCDLPPLRATPYDGITEVWFDNLEDAIGMAEHPAYTSFLAPDELNFVDVSGLVFLITRESVLLSKPKMAVYPPSVEADWSPWTWSVCVKLIHLSNSGPGDADEAVRLAQRLGAFRFVRSTPDAQVHPIDPTFRCIDEFFWPTRSWFEDCARRAPEALAELTSRAGGHLLFCTAERVI